MAVKRSERNVLRQLKRLNAVWKETSRARRSMTEPDEVDFYMACGAIQALEWLLGAREEPLYLRPERR